MRSLGSGCGGHVGVVIPAYNPGPEHLLGLSASVRSQTLVDWACVVVDDGSDRRSRPSSIASAGEGRPPHRQANSGVAAARNRGASKVGGEYARIPRPGRRVAPDQARATDRVHAGARPRDCGTEFEFVRDDKALGGPGSSTTTETSSGFSPRADGLSTLIVRRDAFAAVGGFDERFKVSTDRDLQLRIASKGLKFARVPEMLGLIHLHGENASLDYRAMYAERVAILRSYAARDTRDVRSAARSGRRRLRDHHTYHAIDCFLLNSEHQRPSLGCESRAGHRNAVGSWGDRKAYVDARCLEPPRSRASSG